MQPLPEVQAVSAQLAALCDETLDVLDVLRAVSDLAVLELPSCVGVSITVMAVGEPVTVTATSPDIGSVDAAQYLCDGPGVEATRTGEPLAVPDVLDEERWHAFARTAAAHGIRSSLSVPLRRADQSVMGALNLYASDAAAFRDHGDLLVALFGEHVEGAVRNADLSFATREAARGLPQQLADRAKLEQAVEILMEDRHCSAGEARERIESAALRAGISVPATAEVVIQIGT
ncbi:MAG: sle [Frankiales bacterium]|nr:sle [Frankiales bacterium]